MAKQIHQLVHTLSYGDAISSEVLSLRRCFQKMSFESEIFAINAHPRYKHLAYDYQDLPAGFSDQAILHYSLGSPLNEKFLSLDQARRTLIYHNLTPSHWFKSINPRIVADIERGMRELPQLCSVSDNVIADSRFNAGELHELGVTAQVLELPVDPQRWAEPANTGLNRLLKSDSCLHILHVGRIAPNKCIEDLLKTFYFLHHYLEKKSKLWLVGIDIDTELYSFALKRMCEEFDLQDAVIFTGPLVDSEIRALYENCSIYMCMSEHEGFCLPVLEAMHFGLPVIAYASSALPDTVGKGGILVREKRHAELAELVLEVAGSEPLRESLIRAGRERVGELSFANFEGRVEEIFGSEILKSAAGITAAPAAAHG
ncbi:MAG: hypothetical protein DCC75_00565 [Proteobacteria bacterium]|nr:MAG: hypothetical protein DCC75_00565 [Pseudomonadota bacterium]